MKKGVKLNLYRAFRGEIRSDEVVKYEFDSFDKPDQEDRDFLDKIESRLLKIEKKSRFSQRKSQGESAEQASDRQADDQSEVQPRLAEFSHLMEDLGDYLGKKKR